MLDRPLHLCEVLEDEHVALYGEEWRITPSDVLDAKELARRIVAAFPQTTFKVLPKHELIDLRGEMKDVVRDVNALIEHPDAAVRERNRRAVEAIAGDALAKAGERGWDVSPLEVRDPAGMGRAWRRSVESDPPEWLCDSTTKSVEACRRDVARGLNALIHGDAIVTATYPTLSKHVTIPTRRLVEKTDPQSLTPQERVYVNRRILDDVFGGYIQRGEEARLAKIYEVIHAAGPTSALCISGGGIRSATFGLGVLQGLARRNLLHKFDYLSTVSGGGYIGSWLSSWMRRHTDGPRGVAEDLAKPPMDKLDPEPKPVEHLREFSNYLTPRLGALSGDTLAVAAVYVRNLLLNWTILVPLLLAVLAIPRMVHAIYFHSLSADLSSSLHALAERVLRAASLSTLGLPEHAGDILLARPAEWASNQLLALADAIDVGSAFVPIRWMRRTGLFSHSAAWIGGASLLCAVIYIGRNRPTVNRFGEVRAAEVQRKFFAFCLLPLVVAAIALSAAWARLTMAGRDVIPLGGFVIFAAVPMVAGAIYLYNYTRASASDRRESVFVMMRQGKPTMRPKLVREFFAAGAASIISAFLVLLFARYVFPSPWDPITPETFPSPILALHQRLPVSAFYVCFAVPLVLSVFFIAATVFVGVASTVNEDYDREWWARCSGYVLGAIGIWTAVTAVVIFGPVALHFAPRAIAAIGGVSGLISVVLGRSSKTAAKNATEVSKSDLAAAAAAPVFIVFLLAVGSLLTTKFFEPERRIDAASAALLESIRWSAEQKSVGAPAPRPASDATTAARPGGAPTPGPEAFHPQTVVPVGANAVPALDGGPVEVKTEIEKRSVFDSSRFAAWGHLVTVSESQLPRLAALFGVLIAIAVAASRSVNVNKFSMHSLYRNRLIRAYLGASRSTRDPHPFTGFDPQDNMPMHQLRPELLWASSFRDLPAFVRALDPAKEPFAKQFRTKIDKVDDELFEHIDRPEFVSELFQVLNCVLENDDLEKPEPDGRRPSLWNVKALMAQRKAAQAIEPDPRRLRRNRELLDRNFPNEIYPFDFPLLRRGDVADYERLAGALRGDEPRITDMEAKATSAPPATIGWLRENLSPAARGAVAKCHGENEHLDAAIEAIVDDLNRLLLEYDFQTRKPLENAYPADYQRARRNRRILDAELAGAIHPLTTPRTMHVINVALNLVSGEKLAWQERKAQSFTITPMHSGSYNLGYRNSTHYGGGISLGTAVTISGAAVSPNMGYHSSPPLAFLLTLFNVRLGWWLGNPGPFGSSTWRNECPKLSLRPLIAELSGSTNDCFPYVYLSDGGHFENLGLYEMVLRRRRYIVVSDAGCDPSYAFEDLGNAIRKIRTDLGVPIEIDKMCLYPRSSKDAEPKVGRYCAWGRIRYSCVDPNGQDGELLYIKPAVYLNEPKDVYNYAKSSLAFPHESTADQWFSESQFESYRMLGRYAIDRICTGCAEVADPVRAQNWIPSSFEAFFKRAKAHAYEEPDAGPEAAPKQVSESLVGAGAAGRPETTASA